MSDGASLIYKIAVWALPVLFAITVHEVSHGWVAEKFGDPTARRLGRLTLNPLKHIDPIGTVVLPLIMLLLPGGFIFGWAKPVPVTYQNLRHPKRDMAFVALAGPLSNLIMAGLWAAIARLMVIWPQVPDGIRAGVFQMGVAGIIINVVLMVLNLVPVPPLDGSRILAGALSDRAGYTMMRIEPYGLIIVVALLVTGVLGRIIIPPISLVIGLIGHVFGLGNLMGLL